MDDSLEKALRDRHRLGDTSGRDPFAKAELFDAPARVRAFGVYPFFHPIDRHEGSVAIVDGKRVLMFGSNNYLGLTTHPKVLEAARCAITEYGTSLTGSRLLNGTLGLHRELERRLARFLDQEACLVFSTGYQTSLGVLQAMMGRGTALVLDHRAHASLYDASRLVDGETYSFRHADPQHLDRVLGGLPDDTGALVAVEGVFSMEGDVLDLPAFTEVTRRHGVRLLVDDAHGLGVHGPGGRGTCHMFGVVDEVDLIIGTFSKSLASIGGFVAGPARVVEYIEHFARPFVFTAALPPASVAAAMAALEVLESEPERVDKLQANVARYRAGLEAEGLDVGSSATPVVPILVGDEVQTMRVWRQTLDEGLYVNAAIAPAVPRQRALLRTSVMATHDDDQIDRAVEILASVARRHGLLAARG